jgi:hypothetical protein
MTSVQRLEEKQPAVIRLEDKTADKTHHALCPFFKLYGIYKKINKIFAK